MHHRLLMIHPNSHCSSLSPPIGLKFSLINIKIETKNNTKALFTSYVLHFSVRNTLLPVLHWIHPWVAPPVSHYAGDASTLLHPTRRKTLLCYPYDLCIAKRVAARIVVPPDHRNLRHPFPSLPLVSPLRLSSQVATAPPPIARRRIFIQRPCPSGMPFSLPLLSPSPCTAATRPLPSL